MHWLLLLSLVTGAPPQAATLPGFLDVAKLMTLCEATGPDADTGRAICAGYVVGSVDQLMAQQARREADRRTICPPKSMTVDDTVKAVTRYWRFATTANGIGASGFVRFAMEDSYPCNVPVRTP
jgi:hypothetical protein